MPLATLPCYLRTGVLGRRRCAVDSAAASVCREVGARVTTNMMVWDLDLLPLHHVDARRLEVVAVGLPLSHCARDGTRTVDALWKMVLRW